ncbi:MAG: hypothetical protein N2316_13420, partial [Spirochaetes bacterium]|nr:hypothetical protein [Spirochaetota bacterium]
FTYSHLNAGKKRALYEMRSFNLEPVLKSLEKKHGIAIDRQQFYSFLNKGAHDDIIEEGILMTNSYIWQTKENKTNRVEFELKVNYGDDMQIMNYSYQVSLKVDGKTRAIYFDNVTDKNAIVSRIVQHIGVEIPTEHHKETTATNKTISRECLARQKEMEKNIKDMLDKYTNTLSPADKKKFIEELITHLLKEE